MRIHYIIHAPFENLGAIETWANQSGHSLSSTHTYKGEKLPKTDQFDFLILMGGPQSPRDIDKYPYLSDEVALTQQAIASNKIVLGFCLGAQIIAESLGAKTEQSPHKEVGFYSIELTADGKSDQIFNHFTDFLHVMHWHNDMPGMIAKNSAILAASQGCPRQAFRYGKRVYGLQFHPEMTKSSIQEMISNCPEDLQPGRYIQTKEELLAINPTLMHEKLGLFLNSLTENQHEQN